MFYLNLSLSLQPIKMTLYCIDVLMLCLFLWMSSFTSVHNNTNQMTCRLNEDPGQPVYIPSLIRIFAVIVYTLGVLSNLFNRKDSDWTG